MKKLLLLVTLALPLGACATVQTDWAALSTLTKSIANPVTKADEAKVELAMGAAIAALNGYKRACVEGTADKNCRINIAQIQGYTRLMPPYVAQLRNFVDNNDQINAAVTFNQLKALYNNAKATAAQLGVNVNFGSLTS